MSSPSTWLPGSRPRLRKPPWRMPSRTNQRRTSRLPTRKTPWLPNKGCLASSLPWRFPLPTRTGCRVSFPQMQLGQPSVIGKIFWSKCASQAMSSPSGGRRNRPVNAGDGFGTTLKNRVAATSSFGISQAAAPDGKFRRPLACAGTPRYRRLSGGSGDWRSSAHRPNKHFYVKCAIGTCQSGVTSYQFSSILPLLSLLGCIAAADRANQRVLGLQTARGQVNG